MTYSSLLYKSNILSAVKIILVNVLFVIFHCLCSNTAFAISIDDVIKICNAGLSKSVSAELSADLKGILAGKGSLSAKTQDEIKGVFLNSDTLSSEDKVKSYVIYISCLEKFTPKDSSCEANCIRKQEALKIGLDSQQARCMRTHQIYCVGVCVDEYNIRRDRCISDLCDPTHQSNVLNWEERCESDLASDIDDCDVKYRECVSNC